MCKSESDRAAGKRNTPCDWARCVKERGLTRISPTVLRSSLSFLSCFSFPVFSVVSSLLYICFVGGSHFSLLRSLPSLFTSCRKSSFRLHEYKRAFFGVVVCATLALFPRCFSVVHLDNKVARNTGEGFCLLSGSLADLSD